MKNVILPSFFCLFSFLGFCQDTASTSKDPDFVNNFVGNTEKIGMWVPSKVKSTEIEGSTYLFYSWFGMFSIIDKSGATYSFTNLNYNVKSKSLESKIANDSVFLFDKKNIDRVTFNKIKYRFINEELFLEVFKSIKFDLLIGYDLYLMSGTTNPLTQQDLTPNQYKVQKQYKLYRDATFFNFDLSKKAFFKNFPNHQEAIAKFVKENKLSYKEEADVITILKHITTLE